MRNSLWNQLCLRVHQDGGVKNVGTPEIAMGCTDMEKPYIEWLTQADYDMATARAMLHAGRRPYAMFMAHLSIEKALKGTFQKRLDDIPPKTHNLVYLAQKIDLNFSESQRKFLTSLNELHMVTRYPKSISEILHLYPESDVAKILDESEELLEWIKTTL